MISARPFLFAGAFAAFPTFFPDFDLIPLTLTSPRNSASTCFGSNSYEREDKTSQREDWYKGKEMILQGIQGVLSILDHFDKLRQRVWQ
jgi:hypothetical protein